jgi:hypothetical protein
VHVADSQDKSVEMRRLVHKGSECVGAPTVGALVLKHACQSHGGASMSSLSEPGKEAVRHESAMSSLCGRTGARLAEVRSLFALDFSRLELGAKARSYLAVLTTSNVRAMSRRKGE